MISFTQSEVHRRLNWFGLKPMVASVLGSRTLNPLVRSVAGIIPAAIGRRLPLNLEYVDYHLSNGETVRLLDPLRDIFARDIYWGLAPAEIHKLRYLEEAAKAAKSFLDIGAYAGMYALIAARANPQLKVIAYEIVPENYLLTVRNIIANNMVDRVEARLLGIGEAPGWLRLPPAMKAASNLCSVSLGATFQDGIEVPVSTLDLETERMEGPFLLKIDVEGFESQVIAGGSAFIEREHPTMICEILPGDPLPTLPPGYEFSTFEAEGIIPRPAPEDLGEPRDWLFRPRSARGSSDRLSAP